MDKIQKIKLAAALLGWTEKQAADRCVEKPEIDALYFFDKSKGGASLLMDAVGSVLFANSSVGLDDHIKAFVDGIRTPLEAFSKKDK